MLNRQANSACDNKRTLINMAANKRFIISGGGTGGHIFPAISIANALKKRFPDGEFLFVGAGSEAWIVGL